MTTAALRATARTTAPPLVRYLVVRLVAAVAVILLVSFVVFLFIHAAPGGPEYAIAGPLATPDQLAAIRVKYDLNQPWTEQYLHFLGRLAHGDLGYSFTRSSSVGSALRSAAGVTVPLMVFTWLISMAVGVALGWLSALRPRSILDRGVVGGTILGASAPSFAVGTLFIWVFAIKLRWFPAIGQGNGGLDGLRHLVLPSATASVLVIAATSRFARVRIGQILAEDQTTFARARGLGPVWTLWRGTLKNAGVQLATLAGALLVVLLPGLVIVESVFNLQGVGSLMVDAIHQRDIAVVQGVTFVVSVFVVCVNLVTDVACFLIDPRLRAAALRGAR